MFLQVSLLGFKSRSSGLWHCVVYCYSWRWRWQGPPKHRYPTTTLHSVTTQKTSWLEFSPLWKPQILCPCWNFIEPWAWIAQCYSAGLWAGWSAVWALVGAVNFSPHHRVQTGCGTHPASWVPGVLSLWVKRPEREADNHLHLMPSSSMHGTIPPVPQYTFMA